MFSHELAKTTQPVLPPRKPRIQMRLGVTTTEAIISALLLGLTVAAAGKFASMTHEGLRERELSARIDWELVNARERIGSWSPTEVTEPNVESVAFSAHLKEHFDELAWQAEVEKVETPLAALQVRLSLTATRKSQAIRPADLTFWVPLKDPAKRSPAESQQDEEENSEARVSEEGPVKGEENSGEVDEDSTSESDGGCDE
ncbi:MAG: hypothetical protein AB8B50_19445 [Pirellulaceae bacterium]